MDSRYFDIVKRKDRRMIEGKKNKSGECVYVGNIVILLELY